jgi:uncharacterized membrane protein YuzA (DUF378 family)
MTAWLWRLFYIVTGITGILLLLVSVVNAWNDEYAKATYRMLLGAFNVAMAFHGLDKE